MLSFAATLFLVSSLAISGAVIQEEAVRAGSMGGGYDLLGETALGYTEEPGDIRVNGLDDLEVTAIKSVGEEGGTCSNMNARFPLRLLGVGADFRGYNEVEVRQSEGGGDSNRAAWRDLYDGDDAVDDAADDAADGGDDDGDDDATAADAADATGDGQTGLGTFPTGNIPIAVDYNTLVWIYGGALGSTYVLVDEGGAERTLEVTAVLENSIFAGTFVMAREYLELMYPEAAQYRVFLFNTDEDPADAAPLIEEAMSDFGMDVTPITEIVESNVRYERSFMELFQLYLGFGLVLGGIGLGIAMDRAVTERRHEIGVLRSLGFTRPMVMGQVILEAGLIASAGLVLGSVVALWASGVTLAMWGPSHVAFGSTWDQRGLYVLGLYVLGMLAVMPAAWKASRMEPAVAMVEE
jgi:hypothetical protein